MRKKDLFIIFFLVAVALIVIFSVSKANLSKTEDLRAELQRSLNDYEISQGITILQRTVVTEQDPYVLVVYRNSDSSKFGIMEWRTDGFSEQTAPLGTDAELVRLDGQYGTYIGSLLTKQPDARSVSVFDEKEKLIENYDLIDDRIFLYSLPMDASEKNYLVNVQDQHNHTIEDFKM